MVVNGNTNKKKISEGVTTIGFGNGKAEDDENDEDVHELGSFGGKSKEVEENVMIVKSRKRKCDEAGIGTDDSAEDVKKMKLNPQDDETKTADVEVVIKEAE